MEANSHPVATNPFVGVWSLQSFTEHSDSSESSNPLGPDPVGLLIYTADGYVSAQLMKSDRILPKTDPWEAAVLDGGAELTKGYIAYCGRYKVDEARSEVIHLPSVALLPNLIDQAQYRTYTFVNDELKLVTRRSRPDGKVIESVLMWRRAAK